MSKKQKKRIKQLLINAFWGLALIIIYDFMFVYGIYQYCMR